MPFAALGLVPALTRAAGTQNFIVPTAIQAAAIPAILRGQDVLGRAQTGSGKTAAFALPLLQRLIAGRSETPRKLRALILAPTRELAVQISEVILALSRSFPQPLKTVVAFGGISINPQMMDLRGGADIMVATPGRLLDLIDRNALKIGDVQTLVLDEADRLLDLGFADEINRILSLLPVFRQSLLFSATFPDSVQRLADNILLNPTRIDVEAKSDAGPAIVQRAIEVDSRRRGELLTRLIHDNGWTRALVFVATQNEAEQLSYLLCHVGINAAPFHGELSQRKRSAALADLNSHALQVVIATDVAARGLDIPQLPVVINYDLPRSADDYTHRIGRTGRAGESGLAINLVSAETEAHFRLIENRNKFRLPRERIAGFEPAQTAVLPAAVPAGGIKGKRKSRKDKAREAAARGET
ncbi:MAG: helicase [Hydrocarboniphaga sp.]|uniref:DEAD/DEAH box helicase n=1 Tax=Hydrocarboniphaga sp. TaxID=2033016 RepID=UPI002632FB96|nr:DEAD/DEAH box helicase [Hydrocarboniphaga sp.]MDB5971308.1 helicase [Hydrocarboniphaga sp.]